MFDMIENDDKTILPRRRRQEDASLDITPMIDITFLLLIFFLVTSNLRSEALRTLPEAKHGSQVSARDAAVITMTAAAADGRVRVYLGDSAEPGSEVTAADLTAQEEEVAQYVAEALAGVAPREGPPKRHLLIKAEGRVPYGEVERISLAATRGGNVDSVSQVYIGVQEKK